MRHLVLSLALAALPTASLAQDWWVILGYVDHPPFEWDDAVLVRGNALEAQMGPCGLGVFWDFAGKFNGFDTNGRGSVFVVNTPESLTRSAALRLLAAAKPCVGDAYIKQADYSGE